MLKKIVILCVLCVIFFVGVACGDKTQRQTRGGRVKIADLRVDERQAQPVGGNSFDIGGRGESGIFLNETNCDEGYAKFRVLISGRQIADFSVPDCQRETGQLLAYGGNNLHVTILPKDEPDSSVLYAKYDNLYTLDFYRNSVLKVFEKLGQLTDIGFSKTHIAYMDADKIKVVEWGKMGDEKSYDLPVKGKTAQVGSFWFSVDSKRLAMVVGYSFGKEGEIYFLDLESGSYKLHTKTDAPAVIKEWQKDDELVWELKSD